MVGVLVALLPREDYIAGVEVPEFDVLRRGWGGELVLVVGCEEWSLEGLTFSPTVTKPLGPVNSRELTVEEVAAKVKQEIFVRVTVLLGRLVLVCRALTLLAEPGSSHRPGPLPVPDVHPAVVLEAARHQD